jgi:SAM-dependent methyltransferase
VEEDRLPFASASFDLVISAGTLDSVNDLPGALVQIRRILKPDGLFLGHMFGVGTLATLKSLMLAAEGSSTSAHIHPQIDLRSAADLLSRAGFALPVADQDMMRVRYGHWRKIVADLRNAGLGNALAGQRRYLGKGIMSRLNAEWQRRADAAGKAEESFMHLYLSGWAPSPDQPKPAKRGSGKVSLASILSPDAKP